MRVKPDLTSLGRTCHDSTTGGQQKGRKEFSSYQHSFKPNKMRGFKISIMGTFKRNAGVSKDDLKASLAQNLRSVRMSFEPKITQESVANLFDPPLTRAAIAQWEVGETLPDLDRLAVLSKAFGITIDALVFGDDDPRLKKELSPEALKLAQKWMALGRKNRELILNLISSMK